MQQLFTFQVVMPRGLNVTLTVLWGFDVRRAMNAH